MSLLEEERIGSFEFDSFGTCLWGMLPVSPYHIGYDYFIYQIRKLEENRGIQTRILFPKLHMESFDLSLGCRLNYYSKIFSELSNINPVIDKGEFKHSTEYLRLLHQISRSVNLNSLKRALPNGENKAFDNLLALAQIIDPIYLDSDMVLSGISQRRVYMVGRDILDDYQKYPTLFIRLSRDIEGERLQDSSLDTRINIHDKRPVIRSKLKKIKRNRPEMLETIHETSVNPFFNSSSPELDDMVEKLDLRFRKMEDSLEKEGLMDWIDKSRFNKIIS